MEVIEHRPASDAPDEPRRVGLAERVGQWLNEPGTARAILLGSIALTAAAWWATRLFAHEDAQLRFDRRIDEMHARIEARMASYVTMLRGGVALFAARPELDRSGWKRFAEIVDAGRHYPGIQGFGVARLIQPSDLAAHEAAVRAEGFPDYAVRPPGARDLYSAIVYLEPLDARNRRAFGFDMMSEPVRRAAMDRARDTGEAAMSGIVTLVQEDGRDVQKGFLIYLPVYRDAAADGHVPRPEKLYGWVYAPFRVRDLMGGILGADVDRISLRLHDGSAGEPGEAFYTSDRGRPATGPAAFKRTRLLPFAGRVWNVVYEGEDVEASADTWQSNLVAVCGLSIDLLLYWSIALLSRRKTEFEAEAAQRSAEARARLDALTAVSGLSPDAVLVFDRGTGGPHRLVFTNPAFSQWFGLRPEDLLGLTEDAVDEWLAGLMEGGELQHPLTAEEATLTLAGPAVRVLKRGMREGPRQRVYYFRDITHESEVDRLKNEFLSTAAHELRTPLASVYGFAELMQDERLDPLRRQRAASIVYRQAGVLKHLVNQLLDLARIDARHGKDFHFERIDLRRVAESAAEAVLVADSTPRVQLSLGPVAAWVHGDAARLQQAVTNVLANGLKYSDPQTTVSLEIRAVERDGRRWAALRVVDCGIGMSAEQCERAFERFYRADPSGHILGAGLGLAIAREVVELHQGRVELHSTPGAGTQVTLWLPALEAEAAPATPTAEAVPA